MERYLSSLRVKPERFELEASLSAIEELVDESDLANREVIFLTDGQKRGWEGNSPSITERFAELSKKASISVLPLFEESHENLSVSDFHMASECAGSEDSQVSPQKSAITVKTPLPPRSNCCMTGESWTLCPWGLCNRKRKDSFVLAWSWNLPDPMDSSSPWSPTISRMITGLLALDVPEKVKVLIVEGSSEEALLPGTASRLQRSGSAEGLVCSIVSASSVSPAEIRQSEVIVLANG